MPFHDRQGKPMTLEAWAARLHDWEYRRVAQTDVAGASVSTVWMGLDLAWGMGRPVIFETMIFGGRRGGYCQRYSTEAEAVAGHERVVGCLKRGKAP